MKKFEQKFSDADYNKVVDTYCEDYNYQTKVDVDGAELDNPESREAFTDRIIFETIKRQVFVNNEKKDDATAKAGRTKTKKVKRIK